MQYIELGGDAVLDDPTQLSLMEARASDAEFQRRLDNTRRAMVARDLAAFISFTPENIYYLTAHDTPGYYFYQATVVTPNRRPINVLRRIETTNTLGRQEQVDFSLITFLTGGSLLTLAEAPGPAYLPAFCRASMQQK